MLVTLSTFNDYDFILRSFIRFDLMASLHDLMLFAIRALSDVIIDLQRDVLNWLCTFPPAEMQTFAILTVPRGWRITGPSDNPDHWTTFCLRAQHAVICTISRNTPKMAIFGYFAKIVKIGVF